MSCVAKQLAEKQVFYPFYASAKATSAFYMQGDHYCIFQALRGYYFGEEPPIIGEMLTNKALCLRQLGRLDEAEELYQK